MSKYSRSGGKFTGSHTTCIPSAARVADVAVKCDVVTKVALGFIKAGLKSAHGKRRVKITDEGRSLLLSVRDNASHQELRVFASDVCRAQQILKQEIQELGIAVELYSR